jgi:spermidine/putrescine-binding protein
MFRVSQLLCGRMFGAQLRHAAMLAAALSLAVVLPAAPAAAQMSERQIMQVLGPMMNDEDFNEKLEDFADEHDLDPNMLKAMVARQKQRGMSKQQLGQMQQQKQNDD